MYLCKTKVLVTLEFECFETTRSVFVYMNKGLTPFHDSLYEII